MPDRDEIAGEARDRVERVGDQRDRAFEGYVRQMVQNSSRRGFIKGAGTVGILGAIGFLADESMEGSGQQTPESKSGTLAPQDFKNEYDLLDGELQEDVLAESQYETWFEADSDYEELLGVKVVLNPGEEDSRVAYDHRIGDEKHTTSHTLDYDESARQLLEPGEQ
jgi:hypothetical protein